MADQHKVVHYLSIGAIFSLFFFSYAIFSDLERPLTHISRSRQ